MVLPSHGMTQGGKAAFRGWDLEFSALAAQGASGSYFNVAHVVLDRHLAAGNGARVALRYLSRRRDVPQDVTYAQLGEMAERMAAVLRSLGVQPGDTVAVLLPRVPELYAAAIGAWKVGAVFCPLLGAFGPGPLKARLGLGHGRVLIASEELYLRKVAGYRDELPDLEHVLLVGYDGEPAEPHDGCAVLGELLAAADPARGTTLETSPDAPAFLHFTSGATGTPKGALHAHRAAVAQAVSGRDEFGLTPDDVYWCTAEPGWVTSTAYGIIAPLANGCTLVVDEGDVDPRHWYAILDEEKVTVWYTTPTAIRLMMRFGAALARSYRKNVLRVAASVGEPLNAEAVLWGEKTLGVPFLDTWWQTETGAISIANRPGEARRPGSMGKVMPGIEAAIVRHDGDRVAPVSSPELAGELAIRVGLPSMFTRYVDDPERSQSCFKDGWYLTGDLCRRDGDGFFWFLGRCDDMIKSGAQLIGPFEVESALMEHPAVAEAGVVGKHDMLLGEVPVAFVAVSPGFDAGEALRAELMGFARQALGHALAPVELHFIPALPKTSSGKILRRVLKEQAAAEMEEVVQDFCVGRFDDE